MRTSGHAFFTSGGFYFLPFIQRVGFIGCPLLVFGSVPLSPHITSSEIYSIKIMSDEVTVPFHGYPSTKKAENKHPITTATTSTDAPKKSYVIICFLYWYYSLVYTIIIPALPALTLQITNDSSSRAGYLLGVANFVRYIMEFFASPVMGSLADYQGRKPMLISSFAICAVEFGLLCFFPSVGMVFFTRAMAGMGDCAQATCYTVATDIALFNKDIVTNPYGLIAAMMGLGFVVGPLLGGLLVEMISVRTCFLVSMFISLVGCVLTALLLEESMFYGKPPPTHDLDAETGKPTEVLPALSTCAKISLYWKEVDPVTPLVIHFSNRTIRRLSYPLCFSSVTLGAGSIWYIYMSDRYNASATLIGVYLAFYGVSAVFIQGYMIKKVIPNMWNEKQAAIYGYFLQCLQYTLYGVSPIVWGLFVSVGVFCLGLVADPALKALIVKSSLAMDDSVHIQGNLQGTLSGIRTLCTAIGSLIFPPLYSFCISHDESLSWVVYAATGLCFLSASLLMITAPVSDDLLTKHTAPHAYARAGVEEKLLLDEEEAEEDEVMAEAEPSPLNPMMGVS